MLDIRYININKIDEIDNIALCIGFFDGLHLGHLKLVEKTVELAKQYNLVPALFTFDKNPSLVTGNNIRNEIITSIDDRKEILEKLGIERMYVIYFDDITRNLLPDEFIERVLLPLNVKKLVFGFDFRFGKGGKGTKDSFDKYLDKFDIYEIKEIDDDNVKVSSTRIISLIKDGNIKYANKLLTRPYKINGEVVKGFGNGRKIGFRTANINLDKNYVIPKNGVYAVIVEYHGKLYEGMANIGCHPTINCLEKPNLEVNIFNFEKEIYGEFLNIYFIDYIRAEKRFESLVDLKNQLSLDLYAIRDLLKSKK